MCARKCCCYSRHTAWNSNNICRGTTLMWSACAGADLHGEWCEREQEQFCEIRSTPVSHSPALQQRRRSFGFLGILQWNLQLSKVCEGKYQEDCECVFSAVLLSRGESRYFQHLIQSSCFLSGMRGSRNGIKGKTSSLKYVGRESGVDPTPPQNIDRDRGYKRVLMLNTPKNKCLLSFREKRCPLHSIVYFDPSICMFVDFFTKNSIKLDSKFIISCLEILTLLILSWMWKFFT